MFASNVPTYPPRSANKLLCATHSGYSSFPPWTSGVGQQTQQHSVKENIIFLLVSARYGLHRHDSILLPSSLLLLVRLSWSVVLFQLLYVYASLSATVYDS